MIAALLALELERTRELGLLRALGMTQAGLFGLLLVETGLTGLIAGLISVPVGIGIAATLVLSSTSAVSAGAWTSTWIR